MDLAMDSVARFAHLGLPTQFYTDFLHIADDEARHFGASPPPNAPGLPWDAHPHRRRGRRIIQKL